MRFPGTSAKILLECCFVKFSPVWYGAQHVSDVDEIEVALGIRPRFIDVIYLEAEVWRHESWLNWRQVDTSNGTSGILVGEFAGETW